MNVPTPTGEQCDAKAKVCEDDGKVGYAIWYPQMGGYVGKAVVILDKQWTQYANGSRVGGCFDVYVWHDGEFPFEGEGNEGQQPVILHHCDAQQFVRFGNDVAALNALGRTVNTVGWGDLTINGPRTWFAKRMLSHLSPAPPLKPIDLSVMLERKSSYDRWSVSLMILGVGFSEGFGGSFEAALMDLRDKIPGAFDSSVSALLLDRLRGVEAPPFTF